MSKITMATVKSFIRRNEGKLYIRTKSSFDGMTDCVQQCSDRDWTSVQPSDEGGFLDNAKGRSNTLGIRGAWFVGQSRDYLKPVSEGSFTGFHVYNCCGSFDIAVKA